MFDKILIATDNSPLMNNAIRFTAKLFPYADYYLINVINTSDGSVPQTDLMQSKMSEISKNALHSSEEILNEMGIDEVEKSNPAGTPSKEIIDYIDEHQIDLLVMATHSKSGSQKVHIGETALHSLQVTNIPSLVFACKCAPKMPEKIFNPTTFSSYSVQASILAIELAEYFGASLTTYHIGDKDPGAASRRIEKRAEKEGVEYNLEMHKGASDSQILKRSKEFDLIVGSRGRSGLLYKLRHLFRKFALSSLEKELIEESEVPFLMVGD
ncbi:MAG: universal stress protein [Candidatus Thermoplasmatota archaeon]|nr:universal stress protein [Candidatus Thermoplasmatota archaeon]